jgi:hypothetical protein
MTSATPASAHGDVILVDRTVQIAPRSAATFEGELHYHRLIGVVSSDVEVSVRFARTRDEAAAFEAAAGRETRVNTLVRCCDDGTWTRYALTLRNDTERPATVRADVRLIHDDLAVMAYQAEAGTRESVVIIGGIWLALLWAARRRAARPVRPTAMVFGALSAIVIALALYGAARYGGAGPPALVAALGDVPVLPANPIVSRAALLLFAVGVVWSWVLARWAAAETGRAHALTAAGLIASVIATALAMAAAYGEPGVPTAFAVAAVLPVAIVIVMRYGRSIRYLPARE